jgi:hypothetical protein
MATKLEIYNDALELLSLVRLNSLLDNTKARFELDYRWTNAVLELIETGFWNFATITTSISSDGTTPIVGYGYSFAKPANWSRTIAVAPDSQFSSEADYVDENDKIFGQSDPLYIKYISSLKSGDSYVPNWPTSFANAVVALLAYKVAGLLQVEKEAYALQAYQQRLSQAKNIDAMNQPALKFKPGSWVRAMRGGNSGRDYGPAFGTDVTIDTVGDV